MIGRLNSRSKLAAGLLILAIVLVGARGYVHLNNPERRGLHSVAVDGPARLSPFLDEAGQPVTIEAFRGKLVVLNLWAQWCPPCLNEMPSLDRLAQTLPADQFAIVTVTKDELGDTASKRAFTRLGLSHLKLYLDPPGEIAKEVGARGLPTTLILGGDGTPLLFREGEIDWDSAEMVAYLRKLRVDHPG